MGGVGWERRTACNLVGGLLDLTGVFLATWDGIFVLEFGMISETETQGSRAQTLCDPMDHSLPGSSVHGILQARILEWVVMPFSRGSSQHRD